jgi:hypothetical protein
MKSAILSNACRFRLNRHVCAMSALALLNEQDSFYPSRLRQIGV